MNSAWKGKGGKDQGYGVSPGMWEDMKGGPWGKGKEKGKEQFPYKGKDKGQDTRPLATAKELPGVTDRQFEGIVKTLDREQGFGFLACEELYAMSNRDIFLHSSLFGNLYV